jgi:hypothetical protein
MLDRVRGIGGPVCVVGGGIRETGLGDGVEGGHCRYTFALVGILWFGDLRLWKGWDDKSR